MVTARQTLTLLKAQPQLEVRSASEDLSGQVFGRLQVIRKVGPSWLCCCVCGVERLLRGFSLRSGRTKSCGCWNRDRRTAENLKHGMSTAPEYRVWRGMVERCTDPAHISYPHYGGRGIKIYAEWRHDFAAFYAHVGKRPSKKHSLERIKNDEGYQPGNVRWATLLEQRNNTRANVFLEFAGQRLTQAQWERQLGYPKNTLRNRSVRYGSMQAVVDRFGGSHE